MPHLIDSGRGKILIHENYRYHRNKTRLDRIYWRCGLTHCRASLTTNNFDNGQNIPINVLRVAEHDHIPEIGRIHHQQHVNGMRERIRADPTLPARRVYEQELVQRGRNPQPREVGDRFPRFEAIRRALGRTRAQVVPPIPQTVAQVLIPQEWSTTFNGENFVRHQNNNRGILIVATDGDIRLMGRCNTLFMDGTFKTAPHPYTQMFTVHGMLNNYVFRFTCSLLINKAQESYQYVIQQIKIAYRNLTGNDLNPNAVVIDFEAALKQAIVLELPNSIIYGCFFHFCKAIWRHVQQEGLQQPYQNDQQIHTIIRSIMALAFVPINFVRLSYQNLRQDPVTLQKIVQYPGLAALVLYFENQWLRADGVFPPNTWNVHERPMEFRTNNHVESFHNR